MEKNLDKNIIARLVRPPKEGCLEHTKSVYWCFLWRSHLPHFAVLVLVLYSDGCRYEYGLYIK